jgi:hypothetical protein
VFDGKTLKTYALKKEGLIIQLATGVFDKHSVEIFVGDVLKNDKLEIFIVEDAIPGVDSDTGFYVVQQSNGYRFHMSLVNYAVAEIIGNINLNKMEDLLS